MALFILAAVLYIPVFLSSSLCPKHRHVLNVYFGVPGSGKTTFAAYLTKWALHESFVIRLCRKYPNRLTALILDSQYFKRRIDVYSNVPITGAYELNAKEDIGHYMIEDAKIIIDESFAPSFASFVELAIFAYSFHVLRLLLMSHPREGR